MTAPTTTPTTKLLFLPCLLLGALVLLLSGPPGATGATGAGPGGRAPERPVIVEVEGDQANGFTIFYADGSTISPPTDSEAAAECSEYDTRIARVRCRVEVRTWYRDLGDLQRSLAWVRAHE